MLYAQLSSTYYLRGGLIRAGEAAEILWVRAKAWSMDQETDGVIPREILPRLTPTRGQARVNALLREGEWVEVPSGWQFVDWDQITTSQMEEKRASGRDRQARHRTRRNGVSNAVTDAFVTEEREGRKEGTAAAAAVPQPLPPDIETLATRLAEEGLTARWDRLNFAQRVQVSDLISRHGIPTLIRSAKRTHRPDNPAAFATAWLTQWDELPPPDITRTAPACTLPGHTGTTSHCTQCASERKAVN